MSKIISIGTASPKYPAKQERILEFMHSAYQDELASRKLNILFKKSGINQRYSVVPDFNRGNNNHVLFNGQSTKPHVEARLDVFKENALPLAIQAIDNSFKDINSSVSTFGITHIITVTCTGLYAPGLDAEIIEHYNLPKDTFRTAVNFMGCNAAFHALKIGDLITKSDPNSKVLIVCVELCTIHFQPKNNHDNLLSNTIFGDGAAAVIMIPKETGDLKGLAIDGFHSLLLGKGKDLMGWNITPVNFEMILDANIPDLIGNEVKNVIDMGASKIGINPKNINNYAVHPGGRKILDTIKSELKLKEEDLAESYNILHKYGNMSSPTILFILKELLKKIDTPKENIFAIGFGPGLSIESAVFHYE